MFVLKFILKLVLIPVWLVLFMIWLPVHLAVCISGMFHGLGKLFFGALAILAIVLGMWQNAVIFASAIAVTFLVVIAGAMIDVVLEEARNQVGKAITA